MKILIFGGSGGLGKQITDIMEMKQFEVTSLSSSDCDITDASSIPFMTDYDVVILAAAFNADGKIRNQIDSDKQVRVNVMGAINVARKAVHDWIPAQKKGCLIMMSSFLSQRPKAGAGVYSACKAAVDNLVKTVAIENAKYKIRCNSIQAGYFSGGLTDRLPKSVKDSLSEVIPMGRPGTALELVEAIEFLIHNNYVTGTNLVIDGGVSIV